MRRFKAIGLISGIYIFGLGLAHAGKPLVAEAPPDSVGTPVTVSISEATLTKVPTSQTAGRVGIFIDNPATNNARVVGFYGNCTSTALASTIRPIEIAPGTNSDFYPMSERICLWLLSLHSGAESVHYQEVMQ